jgi:hypothetical protein
MRAFDAFTRALAVGAAVALLAGCDGFDGAEAPAPAGWENQTNLTSEFGGYTMSDEAVGFGDPEISKVEAMEGSLQDIAEPDTLPNDSTVVVRLVWGQLHGGAEAAAVLDWSGAVEASDGRLTVLRTIAFERPADHLVLPRTDARVVGFVSHTEPSVDGLLLLWRTAAESETPAASRTLTFTTQPYTHTWTLDTILNHDLVADIDDLGDGVSISAMPMRAHACPNGFARGSWIERDPRSGIFRGVWLASDNAPLGYLRGHFGVDAHGNPLWFGKLIGRDGRALGLARGTWSANSDAESPGGTFQGHFVTRMGEPGGDITGTYIPGREGPDGSAGFFEAHWERICDSNPPSGDPEGRRPIPPR